MIPFATVSSFVISGITSKAHAETLKAPIDLIGRPAKNFIVKNVIPQPIVELSEHINHVIQWFQNIPQEIGKMSIHLMSWLYQLCGDLILKTPIWIFKNEWFTNTTLMFSSISIGLVTILTVVESIKRMLTGIKSENGRKLVSPMKFQTIMKRWSIVAGLTTAIPYIFQKAFTGLNWVSEKLIAMGADTMNALTMSTFSLLDVVALVAFDLVLIGTVIPVLWKNGRRFFDLLILAVTTPLALTAWIFDDYKHLFKQWWSELKHLSLVQVYYALFLLVLGWFMFGTPTPSTFTGFAVKLLVVIGGFGRMLNPPRLISSKLDNGKGLEEITSNPIKDTIKKTKKNYNMTKDLLWNKPKDLYLKAFKSK